MIPSDLNQLASRHYWQYWFAGALGLVGFVYGLKLYSKRPRRNGEDESEKSDVIEKEKSDIDEDLHSRQLAVYGRETMRRLFQSNVLISGLQGLGAEIAKNLVLAGVKSVTLHDEGEVEMWDLSANFLLSEDDIGKNRAESSVQKLQELNNSVKVSSLSTPLSKEMLSNFQAVVFTDIRTEKAIEYDEYCHTHNPPISFIKCEIRGLFGGVFCDFGPEYTVLDIDGEEPHTGIIASISNENPALVTCVDDDRLEFHDGDLVTFSEIQGMTELNDGKPRRINSTRPYSFFLEEDTTNYKPYKNGGIVTEIKQPKTLNFKTLKSSLKSPGEFLISDYSKLDRSPLVHMAFIALDEFRVKFGRFPCGDDLGTFSEIVRRINEESECKVENIDEGVLVIFLNGVKAVLNPMAAVFGGIVGQEVVKACSSKFHPIFQFFYFDSIESLPPNPNPPKNPNLLSNRYGPQISVFGTELQTKLENSKIFLVGSGALGCEFLKNLALMGVSCGPHGTLTLTDDDIIERSNLSRQFLFRESHVGHSKSSVAASAAKTLNPDFKIQALQNRVSPETEKTFPDSFWEDLDLVINALDNVNARLYVDSKCVYFQKPLLESGTLGPKCNTQVIFPHLTENYGASRDPPEKSAPMCTLHSFPHNISHCLAWARSEFEGLFEKMPSEVNLFLGDVRGYASEMRSAGDATAREKLESVLEALQLERSQTFNDCVAWARHKFEEYFSNKIKQLTFTFPEDSLTSSGALFWSAPKRFPRLLTFDPTDPTHINLIMASSILRAETFGVPVPNWARNPKKLSEMVRTIPVRNFMPKEGVKIETDEKAISSSSAFDDDADVINDLITKLERVVKRLPSGFRLKPIQFEKDDDTNYHMEFISGLANMRARNYSIPEVDKLKAKLIAGRIIPAIATSTSLATGLICLELYKTLIPNPNLSSFKNTFVNLAVPLFSIAEPVPPKKVVHKGMSWTVWDRWVLNGDKTLKEVLEWVRREKGLTVYSVSCGSSLVYNGMFKSHEARLERRIAELAREIGKVEDLGFRKCLDLVVACEDDDGIDVDVPLISVYLR